MKSKDWVAQLLCIQMYSITSRTPFRLFRTKIELGEKHNVETYRLIKA